MVQKKIDKYQIIKKIGEGGMGAVYKAAHPTLKRPVILKQLMIKQNPNIIERFKREARIMLDLRDDHIVQVYDHFKEGTSYFIVMEFVDGISLDKLIRDKRYLSNEAAILIFLEVCKGLKFAHDKGVIHRDIKPANVLISRDGEVKLVDFGIATSEEDIDAGLTKAGATLGTPAFMPPEQISNPQGVDKRADIYAMGVMLYNMTTGKLPYPVNIMPATIALIEKGKYIRPNNINPKIMNLLQTIIKKSMQTKRGRRYKDLITIIHKLEKKLHGGFTNQKVVNHAIKNYIEGKDINFKIKKVIKEEEKKKVFKVPRVANMFTVSLLALGIFVFFFVKSGYVFDFIFNDKYGAFEIAVDPVNKIPVKPDKQILVNIFSKDKDGNFIPAEKNVSFKKVINKNSDYVFYKSDRIYMKSGQYKVEVNVNNEKYNKEFFLAPRIIQKTNDQKVDLVKVDYASVPVLPLNINFNCYDASSSAKLEDVDIRVSYKNKWVAWADFKKQYYYELVSGANFNFMFYKYPFVLKRETVTIEPFQTVLNVDVRLQRTPGFFNIRTNDGGVRIEINGNDYYLDGSEASGLKKINVPYYKVLLHGIMDKLNFKENKLYTKLHIEVLSEKKLILSPGVYKIKVSRNLLINRVVQERDFQVYENRVTDLYLNYNKEKNVLLLNNR